MCSFNYDMCKFFLGIFSPTKEYINIFYSKYVSTGENGTASVAVTNSYYYDYHDYVPVIPPAKPLPPQTGDSGTMAFSIIGILLMACAAVVIVMVFRKKCNSN